MNRPQFVEAARVLAERLLAEHDGQAETAVDRSFYLLTGRPPDDAEKRIVRRMHAEQVAWYAARPDDAENFFAIGDHNRNQSLSAIDVAAVAGVVNA